MHCRSKWSYRQIAWRECGRTLLTSANFWKRAMWKAPSTPRQPWEMIACKRCPPDGSVRTPLLMAVPPSARNGLAAEWSREPSPHVTPSNDSEVHASHAHSERQHWDLAQPHLANGADL